MNDQPTGNQVKEQAIKSLRVAHYITMAAALEGCTVLTAEEARYIDGALNFALAYGLGEGERELCVNALALLGASDE